MHSSRWFAYYWYWQLFPVCSRHILYTKLAVPCAGTLPGPDDAHLRLGHRGSKFGSKSQPGQLLILTGGWWINVLPGRVNCWARCHVWLVSEGNGSLPTPDTRANVTELSTEAMHCCNVSPQGCLSPPACPSVSGWLVGGRSGEESPSSQSDEDEDQLGNERKNQKKIIVRLLALCYTHTHTLAQPHSHLLS